MKFKKTLLAAALTLAGGVAQTAHAEQDIQTGAGAVSAAARLDFRIVIPKFVLFRVGPTGATIDEITFSPTASDVADDSGTATTAGTGGDAAGGSGVNVVLRSNGGAVTISEDNDGGGSGLSDGGSNNISYAQIGTTDGGNITAPQLSDGGINDSGAITPNIGSSVTSLTDVWTYTYTNPATPPAEGTYTGRVTYTAAVP